MGRVLTRGGEAAAVAAKAPNEVTGLTGWWRSDGPLWQNAGRTTAAVAENDPIHTWDDKSGAGRHLTVLFAAAALKLSVVNGLPAVAFDGVNDCHQSVAVSNFITNSAYCVYCVFNVTSISTDGAGSTNCGLYGTAASAYFGLALKSTGSLAIAYNFDGNSDTATRPLSLSTWSATRQRHAGGSLYLKLAGGGEASAASGNTSVLTGLLHVGKATSSSFTPLSIADLFAYNVDPSADDRAALEQYIFERYNIAW